MQLLNTALLNTAALSNAVVRMKRVVRWGDMLCAVAITLPGIILAQDRVQPESGDQLFQPSLRQEAATCLSSG